MLYKDYSQFNNVCCSILLVLTTNIKFSLTFKLLGSLDLFINWKLKCDSPNEIAEIPMIFVSLVIVYRILLLRYLAKRKPNFNWQLAVLKTCVLNPPFIYFNFWDTIDINSRAVVLIFPNLITCKTHLAYSRLPN